MSNAELNFSDKNSLLKWFEINIADSFSEYLLIKEKVKKSDFPGAKRLIKKENGNNLTNFLSFLSELNLANNFLIKGVDKLEYEPCPGLDIDFSFDNIDVSVKNISTKKFEREELAEITRLKENGGGKSIIGNKGLSETEIIVRNDGTSIDDYTRIETGQSGFLGSDITLLQTALSSMGKFETKIKNNGRKKVMIFLVYTKSFQYYHGLDIAWWYFNKELSDYVPILNDEALYFKLFNSVNKLSNIDALIFIFPPNPIIWQNGCLSEIIEGKRRSIILTKDAQFHKQLEKIFS